MLPSPNRSRSPLSSITFCRLTWFCHIVAQHGEVAGNVGAAKAGLRPERIDDLIALINRCRSRKLPEVAGVIEVHMPEDHVINVGGLDADLGELGIDRDI